MEKSRLDSPCGIISVYYNPHDMHCPVDESGPFCIFICKFLHFFCCGVILVTISNLKRFIDDLLIKNLHKFRKFFIKYLHGIVLRLIFAVKFLRFI